MSVSIKFKWLLLLFVALVLPNQQYSYAEPIGGDFKICAEDCMLLKSSVEHPQLKDIHFKFDSYDLDEKSRSTLRENSGYLKANSSVVIEIQGHCDERGTNNYNVALGERRAHSTKMYLVSQGVSAKRIHTIAYGKERPFCFDSSKECRQKNNRVHFRVRR